MSKKLRVVRDQTPEIDQVPSTLFVSTNSKTGYSVNVSIARTCRPTKACSEYCYGLEGRIRYPAALASQARNASFFENADEATIGESALAIGRRVLRRQDFIRMFGVGDLQPGSVAFLTRLATAYPKLQVWVSTRKLELARRLPLLPNLHVMMSCDATTTKKNLEDVRWLIRQMGPQFFAAWARRSGDEEVPRWVKVVFEEHHVGKLGRARWEPEERACPATVRGGVPHDGACARCRFCFSATKREKGPALVQLRRK